MYDNLKSLGILEPEKISHYQLRQEVGNDILKIYFQKEKGGLFAKSVKFKFPRQRKIQNSEYGTPTYTEFYEISPNLRAILEELDNICQKVSSKPVDVKEKILSDLRHLEQVVSNKIAEIEADLKKLEDVSRNKK